MARSRGRSNPRRIVIKARSRQAPDRDSNRNLFFLVGGAVLAGATLLAIALASGVIRLGGAGPTPAPSGPTALAPGTYRSAAFRPQVSFTVPDGWWLAADSADFLQLQPVSSDQEGIYLFRDPSAASQDAACPLAPEPGVGPLSTDLSTWIRGRPGLITSNPRLAEVGGLRGVELDVGIVDTWTASCPFANGAPTVPLFVDQAAGLRWVVAGSERLRLSLLDVPGGGTVVVDIDAFDGSLMDDLVSRATPIVRSFSFGTSGSTPAPSP